MIERLKQFDEVCTSWFERGPDWGPEDVIATERSIMVGLPTVRKILVVLDPALADQLQYEHDRDVEYAIFVGRVRAAARQGLGIARDEQEVAVNLAPESPLLLADRFHPHVWSSAAPLWPTGQYRVAVANAAASLSAHIAEKSGITNLAERGLVQQVFASKQAPGQARLHLRGDVTSDTWRSRQEGTAADAAFVAQPARRPLRERAPHPQPNAGLQARVDRRTRHRDQPRPSRTFHSL